MCTCISGALLYGGEYELSGASGSTTIFGKSLLQRMIHHALCVSHREQAFTWSQARNLCYGDWNLEYTGYLVGGHYSHAAASEFICLDEDPEVVDGGEADKNGILFYFAEARCGSLKCPPYINGRELTCAVCSK